MIESVLKVNLQLRLDIAMRVRAISLGAFRVKLAHWMDIEALNL
jgi:hypothetical protein